MDILDIPERAARVFKYSLRSKRSFLLSLVTAALVLGISFDLLYGFFYTRVFNAKDPRYGPWFWTALVVVAVVAPLVYGAIEFRRARALRNRPFPENIYGIVIAPFEVYSLDPDTLGTASKLQALSVVMDQFFTATRQIMGEEEWASLFEFRLLPTFARITQKKEAADLKDSLGATLVIWGSLVQQSGKPVDVQMKLLGTELDITMGGEMQPIRNAPILAFFALSAAGAELRRRGDLAAAREMYLRARKPAAALDQLSKSTRSTEINEGSIRKIEEEIVTPRADM